ncbi:MAG: PsbP-related protein [Nostocaceae cyanobacterium]|nr:PsbP-related protein [Nostocaceae cyanobacterium]
MKYGISRILPILFLLSVVPVTFTLDNISPNPAQARPSKKPATNQQKFQTFTLPQKFSISYPTGWFVQHQSNQPGADPRELVIITSLKPPKTGEGGVFPVNLIKTDIYLEEGAYETHLKRMMDSIGKDSMGSTPSRITKQGKVVIGGREAYRWWTTDSDGEAMITLVRYSENETIEIASFYNSKNSAAATIVERIHDSFSTQR